MPAVPAGLANALQDRYRLDRELGRRAMATVYPAHDLKRDRQVALKVPRPKLAAALGPERFLREITLTAQLTHPHTLPLLDSGDAGGFLYHVMPYVGDKSPRDRLTREKQRPHYLTPRDDPDPPWRAPWDSVRAELAALVAR